MDETLLSARYSLVALRDEAVWDRGSPTRVAASSDGGMLEKQSGASAPSSPLPSPRRSLPPTPTSAPPSTRPSSSTSSSVSPGTTPPPTPRQKSISHSRSTEVLYVPEHPTPRPLERSPTLRRPSRSSSTRPAAHRPPPSSPAPSVRSRRLSSASASASFRSALEDLPPSPEIINVWTPPLPIGLGSELTPDRLSPGLTPLPVPHLPRSFGSELTTPDWVPPLVQQQEVFPDPIPNSDSNAAAAPPELGSPSHSATISLSHSSTPSMDDAPKEAETTTPPRSSAAAKSSLPYLSTPVSAVVVSDSSPSALPNLTPPSAPCLKPAAGLLLSSLPSPSSSPPVTLSSPLAIDRVALLAANSYFLPPVYCRPSEQELAALASKAQASQKDARRKSAAQSRPPLRTSRSASDFRTKQDQKQTETPPRGSIEGRRERTLSSGSRLSRWFPGGPGSPADDKRTQTGVRERSGRETQGRDSGHRSPTARTPLAETFEGSAKRPIFPSSGSSSNSMPQLKSKGASGSRSRRSPSSPEEDLWRRHLLDEAIGLSFTFAPAPLTRLRRKDAAASRLPAPSVPPVEASPMPPLRPPRARRRTMTFTSLRKQESEAARLAIPLPGSPAPPPTEQSSADPGARQAFPPSTPDIALKTMVRRTLTAPLLSDALPSDSDLSSRATSHSPSLAALPKQTDAPPSEPLVAPSGDFDPELFEDELYGSGERGRRRALLLAQDLLLVTGGLFEGNSSDLSRVSTETASTGVDEQEILQDGDVEETGTLGEPRAERRWGLEEVGEETEIESLASTDASSRQRAPSPFIIPVSAEKAPVRLPPPLNLSVQRPISSYRFPTLDTSAAGFIAPTSVNLGGGQSSFLDDLSPWDLASVSDPRASYASSSPPYFATSSPSTPSVPDAAPIPASPAYSDSTARSSSTFAREIRRDVPSNPYLPRRSLPAPASGPTTNLEPPCRMSLRPGINRSSSTFTTPTPPPSSSTPHLFQSPNYSYLDLDPARPITNTLPSPRPKSASATIRSFFSRSPAVHQSSASLLGRSKSRRSIGSVASGSSWSSRAAPPDPFVISEFGTLAPIDRPTEEPPRAKTVEEWRKDPRQDPEIKRLEGIMHQHLELERERMRTIIHAGS